MRHPAAMLVCGLLLVALVLAGRSHAADLETACDLPHAEDHKDVVMILWRGESKVEAGVRAYVQANGLPLNFTCLSVKSNTDNLPRLVAKAKAMNPDLIYTWGTSTALATFGKYGQSDPDKHVTDIPAIFTMVSYPEKSGLVPSLESSRRNITGATHTVPLAAQIRAMEAYRPIQRLGMLYNPLENNSVVNVREMKEIADKRDFEVIALPVELDAQQRPDPDSLPRLIDKLAAREPQFLYIGPDSFIGSNRETVIGESMAHGIPTFTSTELEILRGDAMIGLYTSYFNLGRYMGYLAERVLMDGTPPASIPVSTLDRFTYALRLSVADKLGLYPPLDVLSYANVLDRATKQ